MSVATANPEGTPNHWFDTKENPYYEYRVALPIECVFDIDDKEWATTREKAVYLDVVLRDIGADRWVALSGKKGIHIHCFLESSTPGTVPDRTAFAVDVMARLKDEFDVVIKTDPVGYAKSRQQFREFGVRAIYDKNPQRKTLWTRPVHELPDTRRQAYLDAGVVVPSTLPRAFTPISEWKKMVNEVTGYRCKTSCLSVCERCPLWM